MTYLLRYGAGSTLEIDVPDEAVLADFTAARARPLDDPAAAVMAALADPLDFPPLARAVVPGDHVALAIEQGVPQVNAVVAGVVQSLIEGEWQPSEITIVQRAEVPSPQHAAGRSAGLPVRVVTHDPSDAASLAYLAASKSGQPIYVNRTLCEADVVLPIGWLQPEGALGYLGIHGGLFPTFSDQQTQARFRSYSSADWSTHQRRRREEADEAAWLLGVQFTLQIVPGPGDSILQVLAGESHEVARRGRQVCEAAWRLQVPRRASLVIAAIEGGPEQQTWDNFARALLAASMAVADDGAIVLCTDLQCPPGPALQRLSGLDAAEAARAIRRHPAPDALPASLLAKTCERARIYLLSGLSDETVEDMGLGYVSYPSEISRLSRQHDCCILLANAQRAMLSVEEELADSRSTLPTPAGSSGR